MFTMPGGTPTTASGSKTPRNEKSPNSLVAEDLAMQLDNLPSTFTSPPKNNLNTTVNPQSLPASKKK